MGVQIGDISNNGTSNVDYATSITRHTRTPGTGPFQGGDNLSTFVADFDQSYDALNGLNYKPAGSAYTVREGDTLQSIAQAVWGDAAMWYLLADANGLDGSEALAAGMTLTITRSESPKLALVVALLRRRRSAEPMARGAARSPRPRTGLPRASPRSGRSKRSAPPAARRRSRRWPTRARDWNKAPRSRRWQPVQREV
jgi:hypothetical protein